MNEQDIRIEARSWCGTIDTDKGASENQVENVALHFFKKGQIDAIDRLMARLRPNHGETLYFPLAGQDYRDNTIKMLKEYKKSLS